MVFASEVVADFINELSDKLIQLLKDIELDKESFKKLGITQAEKVFFDILVKVRDNHNFDYSDDKCKILSQKVNHLVNDKLTLTNWANLGDVKNKLNMELTVLLYDNGYPPEWSKEIFDKMMAQMQSD